MAPEAGVCRIGRGQIRLYEGRIGLHIEDDIAASIPDRKRRIFGDKPALNIFKVSFVGPLQDGIV
jgi:hypothetical protein